MTFEKVQSELEIITEQMSDIVARSHLRATQFQISFLTSGAAEKRVEFTNLMLSILKEEAKEASTDKAKSASERSGKAARSRNRMPSPFDNVGRLVEDTWISGENPDADGDQFQSALRMSLDDFLSQSVALDPALGSTSESVSMWACSACTYVNNAENRCAMCGTLRS